MSRPPWLAVELRHLAALSAVAREGSFRAAADSLGYVQSAVSEQIASLESSIGTSVLERRRGSSPAALTEAGQLLLRHFEEILHSFAAAEAELEALRTGRRGRLRIGLYESVAVRIMPSILRELRSVAPDVKVDIVSSGTGDDLGELVACGRLDAAFGNVPLPMWSFASRELLRDPYVLMLPAEWPLARSEDAPTVEQLRALPLIGPSAGKRAALSEAELRTRGVEPRYAFTLDGNMSTQALVRAGMGAAIVPRLTVDDSDADVAVLPLDDFVSPRTISLYWQESHVHPALNQFLDVAVRCCADPAPVSHAAPLAA